MFSEPAVDLFFNTDDDWLPPSPPRLTRAASVGNSWGVTSIGRGFDWDEEEDKRKHAVPKIDTTLIEKPKAEEIKLHFATSPDTAWPAPAFPARPKLSRPVTSVHPGIRHTPSPVHSGSPTISHVSPQAWTPNPSRPSSPRPPTPGASLLSPATRPPPPSRSPTLPRPRRRSSKQRVSLIAGRVLIAPMEPPEPTPSLPIPFNLQRVDSTSSFLSVAASTGPPTPQPERESLLGGRNISEFFIEGEIGRGAYGLVKRAREKKEDGTLGPPLVIKQIIKSRILADCWKKHPQYGTIPIEIYVMSSISGISYKLPAVRPWDPRRPLPPSVAENSIRIPTLEAKEGQTGWTEGETVKGHPNICPLLDFFEDNHYYYLVLPSTTPEYGPNETKPPSDLFDLVEIFPQGLPSSSIRTYLGQIADALSFLHSQGIVHRDVKDENVVLGPGGKAILIDFGSSGLVKKKGWDTFSGTLDYAGPEILRGERYEGKPQDVWAFGVVAYVLLIGECPFTTAADAQEGLESPFCNASIALDERCGEGKEDEGLEPDGGGALGDAAALVKACLTLSVAERPTFDQILKSRFLFGKGGWGAGDSWS